MSTVKFYKQNDKWFYEIRPGFDHHTPLTEEILFKAFGVTGLYETTVVVPSDNKTDINVIINNGIVDVFLLTKCSGVQVRVTEFVVRLPNPEPPLNFHGKPGTLSMDWVKWKMNKDNLFETEATHIGTRKIFNLLDPIGNDGDIYVDRCTEVYWTVRKVISHNISLTSPYNRGN